MRCAEYFFDSRQPLWHGGFGDTPREGATGGVLARFETDPDDFQWREKT